MGLFEGFWSGQSELNEMMARHAELVGETLEKFKEGMCLWVEEGNLEEANEIAYETHSLEGEADDLRREIEMKLLNGALLARSRRPLLDVVERTDKLANAAEAAMDFTLLQRVKLPDELGATAEDIVDKSVKIVKVVQKGLKILFSGNGDVLEYTERIEGIEGEIDELERDFIQTLFGLEDVELAEKILVRQYLESLVEISDRAEDLSDEMEIITATRRS